MMNATIPHVKSAPFYDEVNAIDDEDEETAYLVLPESPKRSDRNVGRAIVPRERTISSQEEFPKQQVVADDDIAYIEVIVNDIQPRIATLSFTENNRRTPYEIKEDQRSNRNTDVYERTKDDHSNLQPEIHHQIRLNDSKDVRLESRFGHWQTDDPPVAFSDRRHYANLETETRINSETLKVERHRGSFVVEEVDESGNVDAGMKQRSFHHGNFLRYKYPTQFHRPDAASSHVAQKQLRDRLPASLRPNFRYGKEPQLQSTRSSSQRSGKGRDGRSKFPEYPARLRDVGVECEILRIVEQANKCHQVAPETVNAMTQNSVEIRDSSSQHVIHSEEKEVQTKTKVLQDTCTQVRPETRNRMVETSVRILFLPEVLTQNSWTQCEETSDCSESQYSRSGLVVGRRRPMLTHTTSMGGEVASARSLCDTVLEEETEPTDSESRRFEPEFVDTRTRDQHDSNRFESRRSDSKQSEIRQSISLRSESPTLSQCELERPESRQSDSRQSEPRKSESHRSESYRPESRQSQSNRSESRQSQSNRPESRQSQSNRPESRQSQSNRPESRQSQSNRPESRQSQSNRPESRQSHSNRPESRQSHSNRPESRQSQSNRPESRQSQSNRPESRQSQSNRPESRQSQSNRPESRQSQSNRPESRQSQSNRPESRQSQSNRQESRQSHSNRPESRQSQSNRPESRQSQSNRPESRQSQSNRPESRQSQLNLPGSSLSETRRSETRQAESMKFETGSVGSRLSEFGVSCGSQFSLVSGLVSGFDAEDRYREVKNREKKKDDYVVKQSKNPHEEEEKEGEEVVEEEDQLDYDDDFDDAE